MDVQSAVPASLLLGSAIVTGMMRMNKSDDQNGRNRWVIGFSLAIIAAVSTFIISQTGTPGDIVSEDQYMLAMMITTVFLLVYYVCTGCGSGACGSGSSVTNIGSGPITSLTPASFAYQPDCSCQPDSSFNCSTCCGGDIRNKMVNTDCPPFIPPPEPYEPCIDNIYNENCYSKPFIPRGAVPCINTDERRMKIRWDRRIDCPKHREMILKGDYPWAPGTPNWQNRNYVDSNARMWYGPDPGFAPLRDENRNIQGRPLPKPKKRTNRLSALPGGIGAKAVGDVPFMGGAMGTKKDTSATPVKLVGRKRKQQQFLWGQPPPRQARFVAPDISYQPEAYQPPDTAQKPADANVYIPQFGFDQGTAPGGFCYAQMPSYDQSAPTDEETREVERNASTTNWRIIMTCAVVLLFHRCYRNVLNLAKTHEGRTQRDIDPLRLVGENPGVLADAIKQDATMMAVLLSVACGIIFISMSTKKSNKNSRQQQSQPEYSFNEYGYPTTYGTSTPPIMF